MMMNAGDSMTVPIVVDMGATTSPLQPLLRSLMEITRMNITEVLIEVTSCLTL